MQASYTPLYKERIAAFSKGMAAISSSRQRMMLRLIYIAAGGLVAGIGLAVFLVLPEAMDVGLRIYLSFLVLVLSLFVLFRLMARQNYQNFLRSLRQLSAERSLDFSCEVEGLIWSRGWSATKLAYVDIDKILDGGDFIGFISDGGIYVLPKRVMQWQGGAKALVMRVLENLSGPARERSLAQPSLNRLVSQ